MTEKSETSTHLKHFLAMTERQFDKAVCVVRSDNGTEFICMKEFFLEHGIVHETSCVGTPQQNGRAERKHRHILNVARALRFQAHLPIKFWGECILTAAYVINRTPSNVLHGKTPYELLYGKTPCFDQLRVFGCLCFTHNQHHHGDKFASRSRKCIFLGYPYAKKGWLVYDLEAEKYLVSRDVVFCETYFPFGDVPSTQTVDHSTPLASSFPVDEDADVVTPLVLPVLPVRDGDAQSVVGEDVPPITPDATSPAAPNDVPLVSSEDMPLGRGCRKRVPSVRLRDYVLDSPSSPASSSENCTYPIANYVDCSRFSDSHRAFLMAVSDNYIPISFGDAVKYEHWRVAMQNEIISLQENDTWDLEDLPEGKHALYCKWIFTIKYHSDGSIARYKARLVVCGNRQIEGLDYTETFAPVAKMVSVRIFLQVAAARNWTLHQMDVHNAFLHGDLTEEVFMKLPPGFCASSPSRVCRLRKSLYGLKQAPRCWFAKLSNALTSYGFTQSRSDYSLFSFVRGSVQIYLLVYVDDLAIMGNDNIAIQQFKDYLSSCFHMKDLGTLKYFLGLEIARNSSGIYLSQRKYALDIVSEAGLLGAKPIGFPLDQNHKLATSKSEYFPDPERYRRLVGRLIYLVVTRPDLAYCVHILSQFMQLPRQDHWDAALRVVRFLKGTPGQGILLSSDSDLHVRAWCDSDWAGCPISRRSLSGWFIQLGSSPVSWRTKKQSRVSLSSAEAEYRAMADVTKELLWIKACLRDFGISHSSPMSLFCDSQAALHIASNPVFHERTKHVESDCHFVRDEITTGVLETVTLVSY